MLCKNCKICGKLGRSYYERKYSSSELLKYFKIYYGIEHINILKDHLRDKDFSILKCSDCNFVWQKYIPSDEFSNILYEKIIDQELSFRKSKNLEKLLKNKIRFKYNAIYKLKNKKKLNVLDFGSGWGSWLLNLDQNKVNMFAFEISPTRKSYLVKNGVKVLDAQEINNYDNFFDYIRLEQVLEHIPNIKECMELIKKISNKNVLLEVGVPDGVKVIKDPKYITINKGPIQPLEHLNCFSNQSLKKFIKHYDFEPFTFRDILNLYFNKSILSYVGIKTFLKEIFDNFFSTNIKFKIKL